MSEVSPANQQGALAENRAGDFNSLTARATNVISNMIGTITVQGDPTTLVDAKDNIDAGIAAVVAQGGGVLRIPRGDWVTSGNHILPSNIVIVGDGQDVTRIIPNGSDNVFVHGGDILNVKIKDLTIGGDDFQSVIGFYSYGIYNTDLRSNGLRFENVKFKNLDFGHAIIGDGGGWQVANVSYDDKCYFQGCNIGVRYDSINTTIKNRAFFEVGIGQLAGDLSHFGQLTFSGEIAGSPYTGTEQVEKQTIVISGAPVTGTAKCVVTKGGVDHTVYFDVDVSVYNTSALIASAFATALSNDPWVSANFHFSLVGNELYLINIDREANDSTMNFTVENAAGSIVIQDLTSDHYIAGVAEVNQAIGFVVSGDHGALTFDSGSVDEGFVTFLHVTGGGVNGAINFNSGTIQGAVRLDAACVVNFNAGCSLIDRVIRDASDCGALVTIQDGCTIVSNPVFAGQAWQLAGLNPTAFGAFVGDNGGRLIYESNRAYGRVRSQFTHRAFFNNDDASRPMIDAPIEAYTTSANGTRQCIKWGAGTEAGEPAATYGARRDSSDYKCHFEGSQALAYKGYVFDAPIEAPNFTEILKGYVAADVIYNNTAALTAVPGMEVTVETGGIYNVQLAVHSTADSLSILMDFGGTVTPANFIGEWYALTAEGISAADSNAARVSAIGTDFNGVEDGSSMIYTFTGSLEVTTGGTFGLRGAQNAANANDTKILRGSSLILTKLN